MTDNEFIQQVLDEITISGSLPSILEEKEVRRIIDQASRFFYEDYNQSVQKVGYVIRLKEFQTPQFRTSRSLILPDCVQSVVKFQEVKGHGLLHMVDKDFTEERLIASEIYLSSFRGDALLMRTAMQQYFDLTKAFLLEQINYNFNKNTKILKVEGRDPAYDVYIDTWSKIALDKLYEDYRFIRYCTAQAKLSYCRVIGLYGYNLPGGVTINHDMLRSEAETEIENIKTELKEIDVANYIMTFN
jgi:hypothetical protein